MTNCNNNNKYIFSVVMLIGLDWRMFFFLFFTQVFSQTQKRLPSAPTPALVHLFISSASKPGPLEKEMNLNSAIWGKIDWKSACLQSNCYRILRIFGLAFLPTMDVGLWALELLSGISKTVVKTYKLATEEHLLKSYQKQHGLYYRNLQYNHEPAM